MSKIIRSSDYPVQPLVLRDLDTFSGEEEDKGIFEVASTASTRPDAADASSSESKEPVQHNEAPQEPPAPAVDIEAERQEAYEKGLNQGREEAYQELQGATQALLDAAKKLDGLRASLYDRQKEDLVHLALVIAQQVIGQEVQTNAEAIVGVVESALKSALETDSHHIRVNPEDLAVVQEHKPLFLANVHGLKEISVEADTNVSRGGCIIESDMGEVDATIETLLASIESQLQSAVSQ
ncbi:MAG: FliH/SctL family protein [Desulfohalobium sp.]